MSAEVHVRGTLRSAVAAALRSGVPELEGRVFEAQAWPLAPEDLPAALVYVDSEDVDTAPSARIRIQTRTLRVVVGILTSDPETGEPQHDALGAAAERVLFADPAIAAITRKFELAATDSSLQAAGDTVTGRHRLLFVATIPVVEGNPEIRAQ